MLQSEELDAQRAKLVLEREELDAEVARRVEEALVPERAALVLQREELEASSPPYPQAVGAGGGKDASPFKPVR